MLPKKGKSFPRNGSQRLERLHLANEISKALRAELGGTHQTVKTIMSWTCASERTIKNCSMAAMGRAVFTSSR